MASVVGAEFALPILVRAIGQDQALVIASLERAEQAALVRTLAPGRFRFAHALIRHTLYDQLSPTRRALLHRQAAEARETLGSAPGRAAPAGGKRTRPRTRTGASTAATTQSSPKPPW